MQIKNIFLIIISLVAISSCGDSKTRGQVETVNQYPEIKTKFSAYKYQELDKLEWMLKRSFNDFDCDGISDMFGIKDTTGLFQTADYKGSFFKGYYDESGILQFDMHVKEVNIPFRVNWGSGGKLDSADINSDNCADAIYTQFVDNNSGKMYFKFAINDTKMKLNPIESVFDNKDYYRSGYGTLENYFIEFVHDMQENYYYDTEDSSVSSYLKMDWCDIDGNGSDDFIMMWDAYNYDDEAIDGMEILVAYSSAFCETEYSQFSSAKRYFIKDFLYNRNVREVDTEDFNGDGKCDIISYDRRSKYIDTSLARFDKVSDIFVPQKTQRLILPDNLDLFSDAKKVDTFDRNKDGKADINFFTEADDQQVLITFYSQ